MPGARWCDFSYRTHDFEPFASACLGHPNHLTLIKLSVIGMLSVGCLGDGDLPMKDDLHIQQILMDVWKTLMRSRCHTVIEANGGHSWYKVQLICVVMIEFGNLNMY